MVKWKRFTGNPDEWDYLVRYFDGSYLQAYGWGEVRQSSGWKPLRVIAMREGKKIGLATILVKQRLGIYFCWIPGGPLGPLDILSKNFRKDLMELVGARILYCRMSHLRASIQNEIECLRDLSWKRPAASLSSGLTMLYCLDSSEDERQKTATGNWRHNLKRSSRYNLQIEHWIEPRVEAISELYREMETLKGLPMQHSEAELVMLFKHLGNHITVFRCLNQSAELIAIRAAIIFGNTAYDLLAVAGTKARKVYASYATLWALFNYCQKLGIYKYDLSGVDPKANKGVYDFKQGTGARLVTCLGEWEWASIPMLSFLVNRLVKRNF